MLKNTKRIISSNIKIRKNAINKNDRRLNIMELMYKIIVIK